MHAALDSQWRSASLPRGPADAANERHRDGEYERKSNDGSSHPTPHMNGLTPVQIRV